MWFTRLHLEITRKQNPIPTIHSGSLFSHPFRFAPAEHRTAAALQIPEPCGVVRERWPLIRLISAGTAVCLLGYVIALQSKICVPHVCTATSATALDGSMRIPGHVNRRFGKW